MEKSIQKSNIQNVRNSQKIMIIFSKTHTKTKKKHAMCSMRCEIVIR